MTRPSDFVTVLSARGASESTELLANRAAKAQIVWRAGREVS